jgi:hypothetical protein
MSGQSPAYFVVPQGGCGRRVVVPARPTTATTNNQTNTVEKNTNISMTNNQQN